MARVKFSKKAVHGTPKHFAEIVSVVSKARSGKPKETTLSEDQYIKAVFTRRLKSNFSRDTEFAKQRTQHSNQQKSCQKKAVYLSSQRTVAFLHHFSGEDARSNALVSSAIAGFYINSLKKA